MLHKALEFVQEKLHFSLQLLNCVNGGGSGPFLLYARGKDVDLYA